MRAVLLQGLSGAGLHLRGLDSADVEDSDRVEVAAALAAGRPGQRRGRGHRRADQLDPAVTAARWRQSSAGE